LGEDHLAPLGPVAIITQQVDPVLSDQINYHMRKVRSQHVEQAERLNLIPGYYRADYRVPVDLRRFDSGEGRARLLETVRGHDLFIVTDVLNYGKYYTRYMQTVPMSPDEYYMDLTRLIAASRSAAARVNVIMPYLYQGRRYRRGGRDSLDCGLMLKHLFELGIDNFITFDAHDSRVANAVPRSNFETFPTSYPIVETLLHTYPDIALDADHFMVVSPDEMSISRCIFYASSLHVPLGIFYRRRDFIYDNGSVRSTTSKHFLGDVEGRDILLIDDTINTGKTMIDCAKILKSLGARRVFAAVSYALFTRGFEPMNQAHDSGLIERVFATNLSYCPPPLLNAPWFCHVNMTKDLALLIDALNHDASLSRLLAPSAKIRRLLEQHRARTNA
jgi:ribose-phosphate pyrophosphokinase